MKKLFLICVLIELNYNAAFAQPQLILDINPGTGNGPVLSGSSYIKLNNLILFNAKDATHYNELWKTDGTAAGTTLVKDINTNSFGSSNASYFVTMGNKAYFFATDASDGMELWSSDGTTSGTSLVKDINPGSGSGFPVSSTVFGNPMAASNGFVFFEATDGTNGTELWKSDGTSAGTVIVKDIVPGAGSSSPENFVVMNNTVYFSIRNGSLGPDQLWKTDGTSSGTVMVSAVNGIDMVNVMGNNLIFYADEPLGNPFVWVSNGTAAGTLSLGAGSNPSNFFVDGSTTYFRANTNYGPYHLFKTDGTSAGTVQVATVTPTNAVGYMNWLSLGNGIVLFCGNDGVNGSELWATDGTNSGTHLVKDINPGTNVNTGMANSSGATNFIHVGNCNYFAASDTSINYELWTSDGSLSGTQKVSEINPGVNPSYPGGNDNSTSFGMMASLGTDLIFTAYTSADGSELWKTSCSASGIDKNENFISEINVYPNPACSKVTVSSSEEISSIEIYNIYGAEVYSINNSGQRTFNEIDISKFSKGIYFVKIYGNEKNNTEKIIIQ